MNGLNGPGCDGYLGFRVVSLSVVCFDNFADFVSQRQYAFQWGVVVVTIV